ncbi:hypothetical protein [Tianweitania sediminis]|uniref:Uncharacterized protein n=1 Tax=Tianweitania sediminis TaxID=1502156 RepID=A0A8J7R4K4_9HYPH|nr:hypothetical protein [Tianweitania sediminis]MBP0440641.1 hypothetical protein [Tianweitania sediminis]
MVERERLIERLAALTGPDRAVDLEILARVGQSGEWSEDDIAYALTDIEGTTMPPAYTASIDAAVALCESVIALQGRKVICFFCAGGQLTPYNAIEGLPDYHPLAKIDNGVTVGWMAHVAFYNADGSATGPERYSHGRTAAIAVCIALLRALQSQEPR